MGTCWRARDSARSVWKCREARDSSVYLLTVAKGGPKLQPTKEGSCTPYDLSNLRPPLPKPGEPMPRYCGGGEQQTKKESLTLENWYGVTLSELAGRMLAGKVNLPVVDRTGLAGRFDVHLEYVRAYNAPGPVTVNGVVTPDAPPADDSAGPSIFSALEKQLGLKLSLGKAPLDVIIVDHAEKPSAN